MPLSYPVPVSVGRTDVARTFQYTVDELPDIVLDFNTSTGYPEQVWENGAFTSKWSNCRVLQSNGKYVFELNSDQEPWNWKGGGIGMLSLEGSEGNGSGGSGYPPNVIVVDADRTGVVDATTAIQAALSAAVTGESTVFFPAGDYRITDTLYSGPDTTGVNGVHILGQGSNLGQYVQSSRLIWDSPESTKPALWISGIDTCVEQLGIYPHGGRDLYAGIVWAKQPGAADFFNSNCRFMGLTMGCENIEDRRMKYGIMVGGGPALNTYTAGNFENSVIARCTISNCNQSAVYFYGGQPINSHISNCAFRGYTDGNYPDQVGGMGVIIDTGSFTGRITETDFQSLETWVLVTNITILSINGGESESCKNAIVTGGPFHQTPGSISVRDVRVTCEKVGYRSLGPSQYPSEMHQFFSINSGMALTLENNSFVSGVASPFKVSVGSGCRFFSAGNCYPNTDPFTMYPSYIAECPSGIHSTGDVGQNNNAVDVNSVESLPKLSGGLNPDSFIQIRGASTSAVVSLDKSEIDATYKVVLYVDSVSTEAVVGTPYVSSKTASGFQVNLSTAPGLDQQVTVGYRLFR